MSWSFKIGQYRGIGVYVHATFFILLAFVAYSYWAASKDVGKTVEGIVFLLALFGCVVAHEFGHALMAARYGIATKDITLLPIGGVARLERMPEEPLQELWVALAGPAVNVLIAGVLAIWLYLRAAYEPLNNLSLTDGSFLTRLLIVNVILVIFNLLPAFPMDGGRVLRSLLATQLEYAQATQIAASIGQAMAMVFGFLGFFYNPFLLFIAFFVWIGAAQEASFTQMKSALGGIPVSAAMITDFKTLRPENTLLDAAQLIISGSQEDFPVVDGDQRVVGVLTRGKLLAALSGDNREALVGQHMQSEFEKVDGSEMLEAAFQKLQSCQCRCMPVVKNGDLIGILTMDNVGELIALRSAMQGRKA